MNKIKDLKSGSVIRVDEVYCPRDFYKHFCVYLNDGIFAFVFRGGRCIQVVKSGGQVYSQEVNRL